MGADDDQHKNDRFPVPGHKNPYDLNSKIMLSAIISLSIVVLIVVVLHVYARYVLRRQQNQRRQTILGRIRSIGLSVSIDPPKSGLDPLVIASLPRFVFRQQQPEEGHRDDEASATECAVCLSTLEDQEIAMLLPNCNHSFHAICIEQWLALHSTCPICRAEAEPRLQPETREDPAAPTGVPPTAPPLERVNSVLSCGAGAEGTSSDGEAISAKLSNGSTSRLSSFRRILSMERSSRRLQSSSSAQFDADVEDLERQL